MSYILEALKKAESERQLGATPGLHAAPLQAGPREWPLRQALVWGGAVLLVAGAAGLAWRYWPAAPGRPAAVMVAPAPAPAPAAASPAPADDGPLFAPAPAPVPRPAPKPVERPAPPAPEERYPLLADVPAEKARELPQVAIGGYIYAQNPADSLLLVDKTLRREGEEIAPGLVLEKLLRKSAVMNYRGYRYRVPY